MSSKLPAGERALSGEGRAAEMTLRSWLELVVTDLDGTLWDGTGIMHPRTRIALQVIQAASVPVLAATGRRARSAWPVMAANGIALPAVFLDGAIGLEFQASKPFWRCEFTPALAAQVLGILDELGAGPCINVDASGAGEFPDRDVVIGDNTMTHPEYLRRLHPSVRGEDPWTAVRTLPILAFTLLATDEAAIRDIAEEVTGRAPVAAAISADRSLGGFHLSFRPLGVTKWSGVAAYCEARGLDKDRVLAVGDGDNDLELLEKAALAVAVTDASPRLLAQADEVLPPASEGGWAELLKLVGLPEATTQAAQS